MNPNTKTETIFVKATHCSTVKREMRLFDYDSVSAPRAHKVRFSAKHLFREENGTPNISRRRSLINTRDVRADNGRRRFQKKGETKFIMGTTQSDAFPGSICSPPVVFLSPMGVL